MLMDWDAELSEEARDAWIEKLATYVVQRGMQTPAILFLETHKPLTFFASQGLVLGSGFLAPLFGPMNVQQLSKLFEKRANVERLIVRIETLSLEVKVSEAKGAEAPTLKPEAKG